MNLNILLAQGRSDLNFRIEIFKKVFAISLTIVACFYGVMAIAWVRVGLSVFGYFVNTHYTEVLLGYGGLKQLRDLALNFVAVIPMAAAVYLITDMMQALPFVKLIVASFIGGVIYLLTCRLMCEELLNESLVLAGVRARPAQP